MHCSDAQKSLTQQHLRAACVVAALTGQVAALGRVLVGSARCWTLLEGEIEKEKRGERKKKIGNIM